MKVALLLIIKNNKALLFKRNPKDQNNPGKYGLIGGGIEDGETPEEALKREVKEEAGVTVKSFKKLKTYNYDKTTINVFYTTNFNEDEIKLNSEHTSFKYFTLDELSEDNVIETNKDFVEDYNNMVKDNKVNEEVNRLKKIMGINEGVNPETVTDNKSSVLSLINKKRNVGTVAFGKNNTDNQIVKLINSDSELNTVFVDSNPYNLYILYRTGFENQANELKKLYDSNGGIIDPNSPDHIQRREGELLDYDKVFIDNFLNNKKHKEMYY
jgi:mutator protein MutT